MRSAWSSEASRGLIRALVVGMGIAVAVLASAPPAGADAGPDVGFSSPSGPPGTVVEVSSPDVFGMDADMCPGPVTEEPPYSPEDTFEVRWQLGLLTPEAGVFPVTEGAPFTYTTYGAPIEKVVASGTVATEPGVPWSATLTVPDGLREGAELVINASCWRLGDDVPGGAETWFNYFYLGVFTVTAPVDPPATVPPSTPTARPVAPAARPVSAEAAFTG